MHVMKSYAEFAKGALRAQLEDCAREYPALAKEFSRDFSRLCSAIDCHGVQFVLDTMPAYRKHFDKCLDNGRLTLSNMIHFGSWKKGYAIPRLFRGLHMRVFDCFGLLKVDRDVGAIRWIRQLLGVCRKLRIMSSRKDTCESVDEFFAIDASVRPPSLTWRGAYEFDSLEASTLSFMDFAEVAKPNEFHYHPSAVGLAGTEVCPSSVSELNMCQRVADIITAQIGVFKPLDWQFRHGPGAVSDQPFDAYKYAFQGWPLRLERVFPYDVFGIPNWSLRDSILDPSYRDSIFTGEIAARLCAVPKTLRKPRLIACEATSLQWCQQSIRDFLYKRVGDSVMRNLIDFRHQERNAEAALKASIDGSVSTIDLSSASDRISCYVVERLFRRSPTLLDALQASRSAYVSQDISYTSPTYVRLRKYSTMGNATTFPVQTILFATMAVAAYFSVRGIIPTMTNIRMIPGDQVRVFGDDIVIPTDCVDVLRKMLKTFGLKVNETKSFSEGNFRESCGTDAYAGVDVTTANIVELPQRAKPGSVVSSVQVHHNLCERGYFATAQFIRKTVSAIAPKGIATVDHGSGWFGWSSLCDSPPSPPVRRRWNPNLQRLEELRLTCTSKVRLTTPSTNAGLLQFFTEARENVVSAVSTLGHISRRPQTKLSLRWAPV